ncbi:MAG: PAS domain-containing protein [Rhizobiales bacterium]|nr:PAS domain-containing protein [Hyphomicrobiales bacterium]
MSNSSAALKDISDDDAPVRPMFTAKAGTSAGAAADTKPASPYVLFEQSPLTGSWILQGAATRELFKLWKKQERVNGLPLLSAFDGSRVENMLPFMVIHQVHRRDPYTFEMVYAGSECATIMGMSRDRRTLQPDPDAVNISDVYARLLDVSINKHAHFCVKTLGWQGRDLNKYEVLLLPFGEAGFDGPVAILNVMSFSSGFDSKYWLVSGV